MQIKGIDISRHQRAGEVNFKKLRELGYDFVMIRAGYGKILTQKDTAFDSHYNAAKAAGLYVGAYHYSSANWLGSKLDMKRLSHFDVWCAAYVGSQENIKKYYDGPYGMWQYSSSIVLPDVYDSRLDHNYAYKNYAEIIKNAGLNNPDIIDLTKYENGGKD